LYASVRPIGRVTALLETDNDHAFDLIYSQSDGRGCNPAHVRMDAGASRETYTREVFLCPDLLNAAALSKRTVSGLLVFHYKFCPSLCETAKRALPQFFCSVVYTFHSREGL
jgi:hypothetical protein